LFGKVGKGGKEVREGGVARGGVSRGAYSSWKERKSCIFSLKGEKTGGKGGVKGRWQRKGRGVCWGKEKKIGEGGGGFSSWKWKRGGVLGFEGGKLTGRVVRERGRGRRKISGPVGESPRLREKGGCSWYEVRTGEIQGESYFRSFEKGRGREGEPCGEKGGGGKVGRKKNLVGINEEVGGGGGISHSAG